MHSAAKTWKSAGKRFAKWQERSREPGLTALLLIEIALLFVVTPFVGLGWLPALTGPAMFVVFVVATLVVTSHSHVATALVIVAVILSPVGGFIYAEDPSLLTQCVSASGRLVAIAALSFVIARAVFGPGRVTLHRVQGAVVLYMNFALFFFVLYRLVDVLVGNAFHGLPPTGAEHGSGATLLYFSFSTLTTASFGDITPVHPLARNLANLESMVGQLYPATLIARLVSLELEHRRQSRSN